MMIYLTKLNGSTIIINADLIESIEIAPDTIISTISDNKIIVKESAEEVVEKVKAYKRELLNGMPKIKPQNAG